MYTHVYTYIHIYIYIYISAVAGAGDEADGQGLPWQREDRLDGLAIYTYIYIYIEREREIYRYIDIEREMYIYIYIHTYIYNVFRSQVLCEDMCLSPCVLTFENEKEKSQFRKEKHKRRLLDGLWVALLV